jgi:hypothetical protein
VKKSALHVSSLPRKFLLIPALSSREARGAKKDLLSLHLGERMEVRGPNWIPGQARNDDHSNSTYKTLHESILRA